ncbi:MAG: 6-carboxytetrahydropterin synthase [Planctomycetes bacterium]|nr:6-carboxytetrahydropterin synthase [Planctomycetota bacterium]
MSYRILVDKQYFNFSCAHFLLFNDGSREPLHGHNYWAWVEVEGDLGPAGYVLDYITFKPIFRKLCDGLDHKTIFPKQAEVLKIEQKGENIEVTHADGSRFSSPVTDTLLLELPNTSTELLANYLAKRLYDELVERGEYLHLHAITVGVEEAPGQQGIFRYALPHREKGANRGS